MDRHATEADLAEYDATIKRYNALARRLGFALAKHSELEHATDPMSAVLRVAHRPEEPVKDPEGKVPRWTPADEANLDRRVKAVASRRAVS